MRHIILFGSLLALSACNSPESQNTDTTSVDRSAGVTSSDQAVAGSVDGTQDSAAMNPIDAPTYVQKAGAGDRFEIESSKAVMAKSKSADVKKFAQMMIDHHSRATEKLMSAAKASEISAGPPQLDAMQQGMVDDIKNSGAADVDAMYFRHQQTAHNAALALHQNFAANGTGAALKKAANEMVGVVKSHISELQKLAARGSKAS